MASKRRASSSKWKRASERVREGSALAAAAAYGIDLTLIEANLRRTPDERVRDHESAMEVAQALRKATEEHRAKRARAARPTRRRRR